MNVKEDFTLEWRKKKGDKLPAVSGTWTCESAASRRFALTLGHGGIDTVTLSPDGRLLAGRNQFGPQGRLPAIALNRINDFVHAAHSGFARP